MTETFPVTLLVELSPVTIPTFRSQSQLSGHCSPVTFPTFHFGPNPHQNFVPDFVSVTPFWAWWLLPVVVFGFSWPPLPGPPRPPRPPGLQVAYPKHLLGVRCAKHVCVVRAGRINFISISFYWFPDKMKIYYV